MNDKFDYGALAFFITITLIVGGVIAICAFAS